MADILLEIWLEKSVKDLVANYSGVDPGFLEGGFRCVEEGVRFTDFISFFLKYPMKMKLFGFHETKLFHFHGIFKNWGMGVRVNPLNRLWIRHCYLVS